MRKLEERGLNSGLHTRCATGFPAQSPPISTSRPGLAELGAWTSKFMWNPTGTSRGLAEGRGIWFEVPESLWVSLNSDQSYK